MLMPYSPLRSFTLARTASPMSSSICPSMAFQYAGDRGISSRIEDINMLVTVRYFAGHRDLTGRAEEQIELQPGATVGALWEHLIDRYPRLVSYSGRVLFAVNQEFSTLETELHDGD